MLSTVKTQESQSYSDTDAIVFAVVYLPKQGESKTRAPTACLRPVKRLERHGMHQRFALITRTAQTQDRNFLRPVQPVAQDRGYGQIRRRRDHAVQQQADTCTSPALLPWDKGTKLTAAAAWSRGCLQDRYNQPRRASRRGAPSACWHGDDGHLTAEQPTDDRLTGVLIGSCLIPRLPS